MIHSCESCGLIHDDGVARIDPQVEIARIEAEARVAVAKLEARADQHVAEVEAESAVDVAEATAEVVTTILTAVDESDPVPVEPAPVVDPGPTAIIVDTDVEPEVPAPPVHEEEHHEEPRKRGFGMW